MEDLKQIQEFFSKPLDEVTKSQMLKKAKKGSYPATLVAIENGKVVAQEKVNTPQEAPAAHSVMSKKYPNASIRLEDSTGKILEENVFVEAFKLEKALKGMGYNVKVKYLDDFGSDVFEIYFQNPADADESIFYDAKKLGYDNVRVFANPNESLNENEDPIIVKYFKRGDNHFQILVKYEISTGFTTALGSRTATGEKNDQNEAAAKERVKAIVNNLKAEFNLDNIEISKGQVAGRYYIDVYSDKFRDMDVEDLEEFYSLNEYNTGIYYDPAKERNAKKDVPKKTFFSILKDIKNLALKMAKDNAKEASQYIKPGKAANVSPMADIAKAQQDLMGQTQLDEGIKDAINNITKFSGVGSLLTGGGYLLSYLDQLELKYYQWYYSKVKEMADFEIFELLKNKYGIEEQISTWEQKVLMYAFFVFFTIFVVAIGAKLVSKGISKLKKEALSDYEEKEADYDKLYSDYAYKAVKEVAAEKGFSKYLKSKDNPKGETDGLDTKTMNKILMNVIKDIKETIQLGKQLDEKKLCPKGEAYRKRRMAAGEKSSAYLSGRAVKVCKGQMSGKKKKKK